MASEQTGPNNASRWRKLFGSSKSQPKGEASSPDSPQASSISEKEGAPGKWSFGVLNDSQTLEVPGSVILISHSTRQRPLGLRNQPARTSTSSIPSDIVPVAQTPASIDERKKTGDGQIVLNPQPDDSANDPLNWPAWRRNTALASLGWHCLVGGGMTPALAAAFKIVAHDFDVPVPRVALTTGLYMMGLGIGCVISSPTAILYGKRPVYLAGTLLFLVTSVWASESPTYISLLLARIFMGIGVSPCESLPSATIAEIFFLHERAYRVGIYTLLLLGGKNLVPLVSAAIIQSLSWRWVFRIVAFIVTFNIVLLFLFVPETFWDRTPHARPRSAILSRVSSMLSHQLRHVEPVSGIEPSEKPTHEELEASRVSRRLTVNFKLDEAEGSGKDEREAEAQPARDHIELPQGARDFAQDAAASPDLPPGTQYTAQLRSQPALSFTKSLKPFNGRLHQDNWFKVALRPFVLFAYPAVLWSAVVYSLSVGWLIVMSESVATLYQTAPYNFTKLQTGLIYISPFVGGILGTAVAGKVSDVIVRFMCRRNGGLYEPEFRLVMAVPVAITTCLGLMGFGWSIEERDNWIIPTVFFGIISFGCSVGSTTAITFCVDSYRQYAGEALVTLNFSKNIFHGLVFSLFFNNWLDHDGSKKVFLALGGIHLAFLTTTIPLYIYGKRARMWTVRKNMMEKL